MGVGLPSPVMARTGEAPERRYCGVVVVVVVEAAA